MNSVDLDDEIEDGDELIGLEDEREVTSAESVDLAEIYRNCANDCDALAKQFIAKFFANRQMHCGGPIPKSVLESPEYVNMVLHTDVCKGVEQAYSLIGYTGPTEIDFTDESTTIPDDIGKVLDILGQCSRMKVPKALAAGIMLMYLELCEGIGQAKNIIETFSKSEMAMYD
jgi:hypothetical protein